MARKNKKAKRRHKKHHANHNQRSTKKTPQKRRPELEENLVGIIIKKDGALKLEPSNRKLFKGLLDIDSNQLNGAKVGDIVTADVSMFNSSQAQVKLVIGRHDSEEAISLISLHEQGLTSKFSQAALDEATGLKVPALGTREDLRHLPLVTIDGADARDFDDAVYCEKTANGYHIIVAIADVSHYVEPGSELDKEAQERGNSTYLPNKVRPMLPEALSNDLCSLKENEDRAVLAMHMWIDNDGNVTKKKLTKALINSAARLTYKQVQDAYDGNVDAKTAPLMEDVIKPLYEGYKAFNHARTKRGTLDLDIRELKILVDENEKMTGVKKVERIDSQRLIEEYMVNANVCAAQLFADRNIDVIRRIHEAPNDEKFEDVRKFLEALGIKVPKNASDSAKISKMIKDNDGQSFADIIRQSVLRSQMQAKYSIELVGHFGLALEDYAHFTSPIRRYADLIVHRAFNDMIKTKDIGSNIADHISKTERRSKKAEDMADKRFVAAYLNKHIGEEFEARVNGVNRAGLFLQIIENGAEVFVPRKTLPKDHYRDDVEPFSLVGKTHVFRMGAEAKVTIKESNMLTGNIVGVLSEMKSANLPGFKYDP
jgi:ribonuclease R